METTTLTPPRRKKKLTREQAMLGIWAADSDEEEYRREQQPKSKAYAHKTKLAKTIDVTKPIAFVPGGVFDLNEESSRADDAELGDDREVQDMDTGEDGVVEATTEVAEKPVGKSTFAALRRSSLGKWQEYTKGIGSKLLLQMGWRGGGLGRNQLGVVDPIQVRARRGRAGLQEEDTESSQRRDGEKQPIERATPKVESKWKVGSSSSKRHVPTKPEASGDERAPPTLMILDMRGPQVKALSGFGQMMREEEGGTSSNYSSTKNHHRLPSQSNFLPELLHNVDHLVELCVGRSVSLIQKKRYEQMTLSLNREEATLTQSLDARKRQIRTLQDLIGRLEQLQLDSSSTDQHSLTSMQALWTDLRGKFSDEYERYKLESLAFGLVFPLLRGQVSSWRPLVDPASPLRTVLTWKTLLAPREQATSEEDEDDPLCLAMMQRAKRRAAPHAFDRMIYEIVLPKMRAALLNEWRPQDDPDAAIRLVEVWRPVIGQVGFEHIAVNAILNKLYAAVENWTLSTNLTECPPIDTWVLPWVPVLDHHRLGLCYDRVRHKLQAEIGDASPQNGVSALSPWKRIFSRDQWAQLMASAVLPRLNECLSSLVFDPGNQDLLSWRHAVIWGELVSDEAFVTVLRDSGFWKRWFDVLAEWVHQDEASFDEIQQWYTFWKNLLPAAIREHSHVKAQLSHALRLLLDVVSGNSVRRERFRPVGGLQRDKSSSTTQITKSDSERAWREVSFKEAFSSLSEERGLLLVPTNRVHDGNVIYQLENTFVYFYKDLLFSVGNSGTWEPTSVDDVIRRAESNNNT